MKKVRYYLGPEQILACIALNMEKKYIISKLEDTFEFTIIFTVYQVYSLRERTLSEKILDLARDIGNALLEEHPYLREQVMDLTPETAITFCKENKMFRLEIPENSVEPST